MVAALFTDEGNALVKDDILASIAKKKQEIIELEDQLEKLKQIADEDKDQFLHFAFDFVDNIGSRFLDPDLSPEHRVRCKLILFPAGFYVNAENKVYTPQISPIYGLAIKQKGAEAPSISHLVRVTGL